MKEMACMRTGKPIPADHPKCLEPTSYCKHRTACPAHLLEKEAARREKSP